ncbi:hypothetical protein Tco_0954687 [Tanacetum coccineum]|uniref:Uncharacterized protein n=1 Tax=Tanacetum coccineum TaxID=301880 RepID=A0ABQ5E535_9ASTR
MSPAFKAFEIIHHQKHVGLTSKNVLKPPAVRNLRLVDALHRLQNRPLVFKEERKLSYGDQYLQVGNGTQAVVEAIGMFDLVLPSGLVLKLNNCYYAPSIVRGVVSLSCLLDLGFHHTIASNGISVSLNGGSLIGDNHMEICMECDEFVLIKGLGLRGVWRFSLKEDLIISRISMERLCSRDDHMDTLLLEITRGNFQVVEPESMGFSIGT